MPRYAASQADELTNGETRQFCKLQTRLPRRMRHYITLFRRAQSQLQHHAARFEAGGSPQQSVRTIPSCRQMQTPWLALPRRALVRQQVHGAPQVPTRAERLEPMQVQVQRQEQAWPL